MKKIFYSFFLLLSYASFAQVLPINADSLRLRGELVVRNKTKDTIGVMYNTGNGVTVFVKPRRLTDSTFAIGEDTLLIRGTASGSVETAANVGDGISIYKEKDGAEFKFKTIYSPDTSLFFTPGTNEISVIVNPDKFATAQRLADSLNNIQQIINTFNAYRIPGKDSLFFELNGFLWKLKDSTGGAGSQFPGVTLETGELTNSADKIPVSQTVYNAIISAGASEVIKISLAGLDGSTGLPTNKIYWITDAEKEGAFVYVGTVANQSQDNGGTYIVTTDLKLYKRLYDGPILVKWFGLLPGSSSYAAGNVTAIRKARDVAASNELVFIGYGTYHFNDSIRFMSSTSKRSNFEMLGNAMFSSPYGFVCEYPIPQRFVHKGVIQGPHSLATDSLGYAAYTPGVGLRLKNLYNSHIECNEIIRFKIGLENCGEGANGTQFLGSQMNRIYFNWIYHNQIQIKIATYGTAATNGFFCNESYWFGGQLGRGTPYVTFGAGGWWGLVIDKDTSNTAPNYGIGGHIFNNLIFEGLEIGLQAEDASFCFLNNCSWEGGSNRRAIDLHPTTCEGFDFDGCNFLLENYFVPGRKGLRTTINGTPIWVQPDGKTSWDPTGGTGPMASSGTSEQSIGRDKFLFKTDVWPGFTIAFNRLQNDLDVTLSQYPTIQIGAQRYDSVWRYGKVKGSYNDITTSSPDTVTLNANIGLVRVNTNAYKVLRIRWTDLVANGPEEFDLELNSATKVRFVNSSNNATLIDSTKFPVPGLYKCTWRSGGYSVKAYGGTSSGGGSGDVSSTTSSTADNTLPLFSGTGGKTIKPASFNGLLRATGGVISDGATVNLAGEVTGLLPLANITNSGSAALQSIRRNALNNAWEWYTPGSGGGSGPFIQSGSDWYYSGGRIGIGTSTFGNAWLTLGPGTSTRALGHFSTSSVYKTTPANGDIDWNGGSSAIRFTRGGITGHFVLDNQPAILTAQTFRGTPVEGPYISNQNAPAGYIMTSDGSLGGGVEMKRNTGGELTYYTTTTTTSGTMLVNLTSIIPNNTAGEIEVTLIGRSTTTSGNAYIKHVIDAYSKTSTSFVLYKGAQAILKSYTSDFNHANIVIGSPLEGCDTGCEYAITVASPSNGHTVQWTAYVRIRSTITAE